MHLYRCFNGMASSNMNIANVHNSLLATHCSLFIAQPYCDIKALRYYFKQKESKYELKAGIGRQA